MDLDMQLKRFKESPLGSIRTPEQLKKYWGGRKSVSQPLVIDFKWNRIFLFDEFFNQKGPHHLHWQDVAGLSVFNGNDGGVYFENVGENGKNNFNGFFGRLLDKLVSEGVMRCSYDPVAGDYLINGSGIQVKRCPRENDSMGNPLVNVYYPGEESDALEYARAFCSGYATVSRTVEHFCCSYRQ
jgi:hypothetical protein